MALAEEIVELGRAVNRNNYTPSAHQVARCRKHPSRGECGLRLAIADKKFPLAGGYHYRGTTFYTVAQVKTAVEAAGYTWNADR